MMESMVDYVLERGNEHYGQFSHSNPQDPRSSLYNHRKLLQFLFEGDDLPSYRLDRGKRISDLKYEEITTQKSYFSDKVHSELNKKNLTLDSQLYHLENEWLRKKIPDFYAYYFLKFTSSNTHTRMQELFTLELQNLSKDKDEYSVVRKTIDARQTCLINLRRQLNSLTAEQIEGTLATLIAQEQAKKRKAIDNQQTGFKRVAKGGESEEDVGKSWKDKLEIVFEMISHYRKLSAFVVELIKNWRNSIYEKNDNARRFRERVIFFHHDANYLIKMIFDGQFIFQSVLKDYLSFGRSYDPFVLRPVVQLERRKPNLSEQQQILLGLVKPTDLQMDKIAKSLVILAEQQFDEDEQSKFLNERKNFGELQHRKKLIERRRDSTVPKKQEQNLIIDVQFSTDKKSNNTQRELTSILKEQQERKKVKVQTSLSRIKNIRSVDLKKVSPYINVTDRVSKAQRVIDIQQKFRSAHQDYVSSVRNSKSNPKANELVKKQWNPSEQEVIGNKIFNRYIQENLRMLDEATQKAFFANRKPQSMKQLNDLKNARTGQKPKDNLAQTQTKTVADRKMLSRQKIPYQSHKNLPSKGTRAIIQISSKGVRNNEQAFGNEADQPQRKQRNQFERNNLFESEKKRQIIVVRQQPEKLQEIKSFLYTKIKQEMLEEMKRNKIQKQIDLNNMIEAEKKRREEERLQQLRLEQLRRIEEAQRKRIAQLQKQKKKINYKIEVRSKQFTPQQAQSLFQMLPIDTPHSYYQLFFKQTAEQKLLRLSDELHFMVLIGSFDGIDTAYAIVSFDWRFQQSRRMVFEYLAIKDHIYFISAFHSFCQFLYQNDPVQLIQMSLYRSDALYNEILQDVQQYADRRGSTQSKLIGQHQQLLTFAWQRPIQNLRDHFPYTHFYFGCKIDLKCQIVSSAYPLAEVDSYQVDKTLQLTTNYIFLMEELFRKYLTPDDSVQLRENSTNLRRLKDIFQIILQLNKSNPKIQQLTIVEGQSLLDISKQLNQIHGRSSSKCIFPALKDRQQKNRILVSNIQLKLELGFPILSCHWDKRRFLRLKIERPVTVMKSSMYTRESIYILKTDDAEVDMFMIEAEHYRLMKVQLFVFLSLLFNNMVGSSEKHVGSIWCPQFAINSKEGRRVRKTTDFGSQMKKNIFLSEQLYFCNNEYIQNAIGFSPSPDDIVFKESLIVGFLHKRVEAECLGLPVYAKVIDESEMF